ncbi:serine/threonine-protein kinase mTOR [Daktulosphaira vitifoliae]|uniref:serine/threonine-protein kinase mTOR n=1 Tax=Daktulosphaira vitifoliae TaxID=58002 RepID=UPI0021A9EB57|nr:serine/threonine-protein kinase mTOR [Daktulosphaira vitifoliae]
MSSVRMQHFVTRLKSKNFEVRKRAARDLNLYVKTELREVSAEERAIFNDEFNHHIFEMVSSSDSNEKIGGILAILCLIGADVGNKNNRISRFANYLRNLLPSTDLGVMELAAKTVGKLALDSGTYADQYVEFEVKRAFEWLSGIRNEPKRYAAVLILREIATMVPTLFFQHAAQFFDLVLNVVRDPKPNIRDGAVEALRAALVVTAQRETSKQTQKSQWYKQCYEEVINGLDDNINKEKGVTRDDKIHGSILVLNELLRVSNINWERQYDSLMQRLQWNQSQTNAEILSLLPRTKSALKGLVGGSGRTDGDSVRIASSGIRYESSACKNLLQDNYDRVCSGALSHRLSRSPLVHSALMKLLPRLAAFNKSIFVQNYLNSSMMYLLSTIRGREREQRTNAFVAVGLVAIAVEDHTKPYLARILDVIRTSLPSKDSSSRKRLSSAEPAVYVCITLLGIAAQNNIKSDLKELLEPMLAMGLSPTLTIALKELAVAVPSLKKDISEGLLRMLSQVLNHRHVPITIPISASSSTLSLSIASSVLEPQNIASVVLALRTLGNFNFEGHSLLQFLRRCAEHYLGSEQQEVRVEAVRTCSRLLRLAIESPQSKSSHTVRYTITTVIKQILVVGVSDTDPDVRYTVFENLDRSFDFYLAQVHNLTALFMAMNDVNFEIREMALCTIGRLSLINPAYVMPPLRKTLMQCLTELEHSGMGRNKEQSARMIDHMAVHAPRLVSPYVQPVLKILIPKLGEPDLNPGILISILACIGDLAQVNGEEMCCWTDELLPILLDMLGDGGSQEKRGVALWVLGKLVEGLGYVIQPYEKYPTLLDTLLGFLKTEQQPLVRRETIRVLGLLGALDPYKHKMNLGQIDSQIESTAFLSMTDSRPISETEWTTSEMLVNMSTATLEEYYPAVAIATLIRIIRDPNLFQHHTMVVQAITFIFQSLGIKCVPYIPQVMPSFLNVIRTADANFREYLLQQLAVLINIVGQHVRNYLDDIFLLIKELWTPNSSLQCTLIQLVEYIVVALGAQFKTYLSQLMPNILRILYHDSSKNRNVTKRMVVALCKFGINLDEYLHMIMPPLVNLFDATEHPTQVSQVAMETVAQLAYSLDFTDFASRIIHGIVNSIENTPELRKTAMETLCALICQLGRKYVIFMPLVSRTLNKCQYNYPAYDTLITYISSNSEGSLEENLLLSRHKQFKSKKEVGMHVLGDSATIIKKMHTSLPNLQKAWLANRCVSKDDWLEWLRRLGIDFLKESPSPALRSCWALAQTYSQLPKDLFNAAFVSCWTELTEPLRKELIQTLEQALMVSDLPEMTQTILNLAEFMDHCEKGPLPIDTHILGERAMDCRAYAKALHYKEDEFIKEKNRHICPNIVESLISINNKLQQKEAASGLLEVVMSKREEDQEPGEQLKVQARWYEKLHNWEQALSFYESCLQKEPHDVEWSLGEMRCLESLGQWGKLSNVAASHWLHFPENGREKMSRVAAAAAWGLNQWQQMSVYVECIPRDTMDGAFYRAVLSIHGEHYERAQKYIDLAREILDTELTAMAAESYQRAYGAMVSVQMLAELEEVIQYKLKPEKRPIIYKVWWDRLQGCQRVVEDWQRIIQVHSLVLSPKEDMHTWLKYAALCRKSSRLVLSHKTLTTLLGIDPSQNPNEPLPVEHPHVTFAYIKHMWTSGAKMDAYNHLNTLIQNVLPQLKRKGKESEKIRNDSTKKLLARCYLKLGCWQEELQGLTELSIPDVLDYYSAATTHDPSWYKAWHSWAYMNFETVLFYKHQYQNKSQSNDQVEKGTVDKNNTETQKNLQYVARFTVPAVEGFFRSISLSHGSSLQDTLRLLTLWFEYGQQPEVYEAIVDGLRSSQINTWLQVIPQLIARIDTPRTLVSRLIHHLLIDIGKHHPQALVYPLTVANKSASMVRRNAANKILKTMCEHSPNLVQQAVMVSDELLRVAILWHELWHEALEEASRLYFGENNIKGMYEVLEPLHAMLERGPQTLKETSFNQTYGRDLVEALDWCNRFLISGNNRDLNQAWDLYYHVFRRISRQLPQLTSLELQYVSPKLQQSRNMELAVPGSYIPGQPVVRIAYIQNSLQVITSKQRPRKLCIKGSDGNDYMFLLKGHEDLRQDERVMQLFGLVNTLLLNDPDTFRRNLTIQRYAVIPLSTNSGLIGWVPHCDTLHTLIRDYRDKKKILLNIEHRIMLRMAPNYDHLTLMQKVEVFEHALANTQGDDLARLLWLKSPSSEVWFDRRTNYTRSLAVMSMVGYILGLGDRHPSNLMLDRLSGKILHIDFGDCFEVAMTREKFPEKIPFRLTRMLINAMEVTGIEGTYRSTCESVMTVLRNNKDSLMAVLEAFVYDPLLNWRLMEAGIGARRTAAATAGATVVGTNPISVASTATTVSEEPSMAASFAASLSKKAAPLNVGTGGDLGDIENEPTEALNKKALAIVTRVREKLTGRDFVHEQELTVPKQVHLLIQQATANENLCQCYIGWCPFW